MGQAKQRGSYEDRILQAQAKMTQPMLTSFYWGYKADKPEGLEVSNMTFLQLGMKAKEITELGQLIKDAVDIEVQIYKEMPESNDKDYIAQQWHNLHAAMKKAKKLPQTITDVMPALIMFACAVSSLVAAGEIEQSEFSGDKFGHMQMDAGLWAAMNKQKEPA